MKLILIISLFTLLLQCKNSSTVNSTENAVGEDTIAETEVVLSGSWWRDTTSEAATAKAGEFELDRYRTVWIDYNRFFDMMLDAPPQEEANEDNRILITLPLPNDEIEEFAIHQVQVMSPQLAEKYPQIRTYEGRSTSDPTTSIRLDFGENGAHYMVIKGGEQIYLEPVTKGKRDIYIIYNKKDVKKYPIDFEKPER
jgi:hypothetical protein